MCYGRIGEKKEGLNSELCNTRSAELGGSIFAIP